MRSVVLALAVVLAGCSRPVRDAAPDGSLTPAVIPPEAAPPPPLTDEAAPFTPRPAAELHNVEEGLRCWEGVTTDLLKGRIRHGMRLTDVIAVYKPDVVFVHDGYTTAGYCGQRGYFFSSLSYAYLIARDGKLVRAHGLSCVWRPIFFNSLSAAEFQDWSRGYDAAFWQLARGQAEIARQQIAGMAAAGPVAAIVHFLRQ